MATHFYNTPRLVDFVLSEAKGQRSRENIVVTQAGAEVLSGTVLSKTVGGKYIPYVTGGSATADAILYEHLPAKTGDAEAVGFVRDMEANRFRLTGLAGDAIGELAEAGIIVRGDPTALRISTPAL